MTLDAGTAILSAPSSGPYRGMVVFVDPACTGGEVRLKGHPDELLLTGTVYAPTRRVKVDLRRSVTVTQQIVADTVLFTSAANYPYTVNFDANLTARALSPGLVE